ncbi:hypothetical protein Hanom_Chr04g00383441 [Helianthus anomalus]
MPHSGWSSIKPGGGFQALWPKIEPHKERLHMALLLTALVMFLFKNVRDAKPGKTLFE